MVVVVVWRPSPYWRNDIGSGVVTRTWVSLGFVSLVGDRIYLGITHFLSFWWHRCGERAYPSTLHSMGWLKIYLLVVWLDWRFMLPLWTILYNPLACFGTYGWAPQSALKELIRGGPCGCTRRSAWPLVPTLLLFLSIYGGVWDVPCCCLSLVVGVMVYGLISARSIHRWRCYLVSNRRSMLTDYWA